MLALCDRPRPAYRTSVPTTAARPESVAPNNWRCPQWAGLGSPGRQTWNPSVQTLSPYGRRLPYRLRLARAGLSGWRRVRGPEVSQWYAVVRPFLGAVLEMARRFDGTAPAHVRTALHLLRELDDQLHHGGFSRRDRFELVRLLTAARRQLRLAVV